MSTRLPPESRDAGRSGLLQQRTWSARESRTADVPDPIVWSGRAVQEGFVDLADAVLHQCIRSLIGARHCSRPSWISARVRAHYRIGLKRADGVTSVRKRREDRSSISFYPLADLGGLLRHRTLLIGVVPLFAPLTVPSSRPADAGAPRARDRQGWPSRWPCVLLLRCQATP
jgi:hypothetical protein